MARRKNAKASRTEMKPGRERAKSGLRNVFRPLPKLIYWGSVMGLWGLIAVGGIIAFYAAQLPSAEHWAIPERPPNVRIVAADGSLIANRGLTGGKALRLEEMSPHIPQAVIAIEDRRFHRHFGFDPIGFTRAMVRNLIQKQLREGGSTITQQLAKNLFLTPERSFGRKVQELILSVWLEAKFTKAQILELYLNRVYFGAGATGVDAASQRYFGKPAKHVTLPEAALLAGLLKAPSRYSPVRNPKLARKRARVVLKAMQREGYVKPGSIDADAVTPGENARHFRSGPNHYIADMVMKRLEKLSGKLTRDIVVKTTISPYLMTAAQQTLGAALKAHSKKRRVDQAALVSLAPDGAIRALIGGRDYGKSGFNRAVGAKRQPGSAFKTFVWLAAMENAMRPGTVVNDAPVRYGKWQPRNYDNHYRGAVTLQYAFADSLNTVSAQLTMQLGPRRVARAAGRLGISSTLAANASLALGTSEVSLFELTSSYAPFANGGSRAKPWLIESVKSAKSEGRTKVIYQRIALSSPTVVDSESLGAMNAMMRGVLTSGTGTAAKLKNHPAGGKTGTSQNFRDALFVGHTAHLVTGVWFGNDDNSPTKKLTGGSLPAKVWHEFMTSAHHDLPVKQLPGAPILLSDLPTELPMPTFRPTAVTVAVNQGRPQSTGSLRERVTTIVEGRAKRTIFDLITGK
ncbi:MAG: transglycosylase domain-containing protein [Rhizobiaceae bacterium]